MSLAGSANSLRMRPDCGRTCKELTDPARQGARSIVETEGGDEHVAGDLDPADRLHLLLALLLLPQQFALAGDVAAVALGEDVLAPRPDGLTGDHLATDGGLDRHIEHLARDQLLQLLGHLAPV